MKNTSGEVMQIKKQLSALPVTLALALLAACSQPGPEELVASAENYIKKGEPQSAILQLKNALDQDPNYSKARVMLGRALLEAGDPVAAIVELRKAQKNGYSAEEVVPSLAKSMLSAQQNQAVIEEFGAVNLASPSAYAELKTVVATAYALAGKDADARAALQAALAKVPDFPPALMLQARMAGSERRGDDAMAIMEKVLSLTPKDPQAWYQKGELLAITQQNIPLAMEAFRAALAIQPSHTAARAALTEALIGQRDFKAAAEQLALLRKSARNNLMINFLEAKLAFSNGDLKKAAGAIELALKAAPAEGKVLQLAGTIQLANGALLQAERSLSQALTIKPDHVLVRELLAQTQMRMGQPAKALVTLQPLVGAVDGYPQAHGLAGEAFLALGDLEQSRKSFETAVKLDPSNSANLIKLALAKEKTAGYRVTSEALQKIAATDKGTNADLALISLLLQNKDLTAALKAVESVEAKLPKNPLPHNLRAKINLLRNDARAARASFEQALSIDPVFVPAVAGLASLDVRDKNIDAAKRRFDAVLKVDPRNLDALLAMVQLRTLEGAPKPEIVEMLSKAIQLNPVEPAPRLQLINLQLSEGNPREAQTAARDANAAIPDQADLVDALGRTEVASDAAQQAMATFNKLATLEPKSTRPFMRLAAVQLTVNKAAAAEQNLRRALALAPNFLPAQQALVKVAIAGGRQADAIAVARTVQVQRPNETVGHDMEAEIEMSRGKTDAAIDVYRRALKKYSATIFAVKLHAALRGAKKTDVAERMAAEWLVANPKDAGFPAYLGDLAMSQGQFEIAEKYFRQVIAIRPSTADALNNIAYCLIKQNKPGALALAEQAVKLQPEAPGMLDTLAMALAMSEKQLPKAIEVQRRAVALAPENLMLRFGLAKLLVQSGDKAAAAIELKGLEKAGERFPEHAEVARLLKSL